MKPEAALVSYNLIDKDDERFHGTHMTASGIKFDDRWILTHGSFVSWLKAAASIVKAQVKSNEFTTDFKYYRRLPKIYVTYENTTNSRVSNQINTNLCSSSKEDVNSNFYDNIITTAGVIKLIWHSAVLRNIFESLFTSWTIGSKPGNVDCQDELGKQFLPVFCLIDVGDPETSPSPRDALGRLYEFLSHDLPQRSDQLTIIGTPFGNEVFLNSLTKGAVCNMVGRTSNVLLCDAPTSTGFEGGPVLSTKSGALLGIILSSVSWWRGEWVGITLVAFLTPIIHELLKPHTPFHKEVYTSPKDLLFSLCLDKLDHIIALIRCGQIWGSGILIGKGYILTCSHVVKRHNSQRLSVYLAGKTYSADVLFKSRDNMAYDLALLQVHNLNYDGYIQSADEVTFRGENVVAIGFPYFSERDIDDLKPTIVKGTVNNVSPFMIQTSCCIQSGYSGGAILRIIKENNTLTPYLLGVIVCNAKDDSRNVTFPHLNMAIPVHAFKNVLYQYFDNPKLTHILNGFENPTQNVQSLWRLQLNNSKL